MKVWILFRTATLALLVSCAFTGCASIGPATLDQTRLQYNEAVKRTTEEQLLLNIVRLRYTDTPSSLAVSSIAAQFERTQSVAVLPFFTAAGGDISRSFTTVLPQAQFQAADRPTFSLTPLDDQEFTRKLFTPLPLDGVIYLAKTTWPISKVFRLYLENLNWIPNAQTASGPTPRQAPPVSEFLRGVAALQSMQDRGAIVFGLTDREEQVGGALPAATVSAGSVIEAAKNGLEYRPDEDGRRWRLFRKTSTPVLRLDPDEIDSPDVRIFEEVFHLRPGATELAITQEALTPFRSAFPKSGLSSLDLETRSLLQTLYYVSHGVEVPADHQARGLVTVTRDAAGQPFDWHVVMRDLFHVHTTGGKERPGNAHVAVNYRGHWFYVDESDQDTKATFSLLVELSRLELSGKTGPGPQLTLPVGR
jgi:hypothetical protein